MSPRRRGYRYSAVSTDDPGDGEMQGEGEGQPPGIATGAGCTQPIGFSTDRFGTGSVTAENSGNAIHDRLSRLNMASVVMTALVGVATAGTVLEVIGHSVGHVSSWVCVVGTLFTLYLILLAWAYRLRPEDKGLAAITPANPFEGMFLRALVATGTVFAMMLAFRVRFDDDMATLNTRSGHVTPVPSALSPAITAAWTAVMVGTVAIFSGLLQDMTPVFRGNFISEYVEHRMCIMAASSSQMTAAALHGKAGARAAASHEMATTRKSTQHHTVDIPMVPLVPADGAPVTVPDGKW